MISDLMNRVEALTHRLEKMELFLRKMRSHESHAIDRYRDTYTEVLRDSAMSDASFHSLWHEYEQHLQTEILRERYIEI